MVETRKLAAILAADVVGFSRLASADEDRTLARLRALRSDLIDPTIAVHHGRVVKRTGDGSIIEFRSVVDAVHRAVPRVRPHPSAPSEAADKSCRLRPPRSALDDKTNQRLPLTQRGPYATLYSEDYLAFAARQYAERRRP